MQTFSIYNQVVANLERGTAPKSRILVLNEYFRKYLPSLQETYPIQITEFLNGDISYEQMIDLIIGGIASQKKRQVNRILQFDRTEERLYGPRSMPPTPTALNRIPLERELIRFREAFGPGRELSPVRVPGTREVIDRTRSIFGMGGAW